MTTLELADALDADADLCYAEAGNWNVCALEWNAAKELRRLHEVNAELLEALKNYSLPIDMNNIASSVIEFGSEAVTKELLRRAAITKVEGETA